jgi:hypothetical protein
VFEVPEQNDEIVICEEEFYLNFKKKITMLCNQNLNNMISTTDIFYIYYFLVNFSEDDITYLKCENIFVTKNLFFK